jgi:ribonucleoside-diphosphate reductase alpha chain
VGSYDDGNPGEIFLRMAKEGSTISGLMDTIATMTSIALQYGVPLKALVDKFSHTRFEPSGFTNNREIPIAKSITDYVFRYLGNRFLQTEPLVSADTGEPALAPAIRPALGVVAGGTGSEVRDQDQPASFVNQADAPSCMDCGSIMVRNGACYKCANCGSTSGCS